MPLLSSATVRSLVDYMAILLSQAYPVAFYETPGC